MLVFKIQRAQNPPPPPGVDAWTLSPRPGLQLTLSERPALLYNSDNNDYDYDCFDILRSLLLSLSSLSIISLSHGVRAN